MATQLPLCGFVPPSAPFFFGAEQPPSETWTSVPSSPPPDEGKPTRGLRRLLKPNVPGSRDRWRAQITRLRALPGARLDQLAEVEEFVEEGYKMRFKAGPPPPGQYGNTFTFRQHKGICMERLQVYEELGALHWLSEPPPPGGYSHVQPLHAVVKPGKKARVCVDLSRNLNDYVVDEAFKLQSVDAAVRLSQQCPARPYYVKLDISSCYLSFPVHPDDAQYYVCEVDGKFLQFDSVVFGHKDAPRIVSLALDVVSAALTEAGIAHVRYIDDFFLVATTAERAWACAHRAADIIADFGLALAPAKVEGPSQVLEFLGIVLDSAQRTLSISTARRDELLLLLRKFSGLERASVQALQSLIGKLSFAATVLPGSRPFLRRMIDLVRGPRGRRRLDTAFRADVDYWLAAIDDWNGTAVWRRDASDPFVFGSDASIRGFGYGMEACPARVCTSLPAGFQPGDVRMGLWSWANGDAARQEVSGAIQYGEAFCAAAAAVEYGPLLRDSHVVFVIDNKADTYIFNRQTTRDARVCKLLRVLCDQARRHNFTFSAVHRAGEANELFDWASRPNKHKFTAAPAAFQPTSARTHVHVAAGVSRYPPLLHACLLVYVNSRCMKFGPQGNSASWSSTSGGW
jgi:hypothetical protein